MPIRLSGNPATVELEVLASLLSYAIVDDPKWAEQLFNDFCYTPTDDKAEIPLKQIAPLNFDEFLQLFELFPRIGIEAAIEDGIYGTSVRADLDSPLSLGVYANERGTEYLGRALDRRSVLRRFPIRAVPTSKGISFAQAPVTGGVSVSRLYGAVTGTMGAWLHERNGGVLGVSNNHVICEFNRFGRGADVIQPGAGDGGSPSDVIARVEDYVYLPEYNVNLPLTTANTADLVWCRPVDNDRVDRSIGKDPAILPTGECDIDYDVDTNKMEVDVCAYGKKSEWMRGKAVALAWVWLQDNRYSPARYRFRNQIELSLDKVEQGDSGAIVIRQRDSKIGGILFAVSDPGRAFASPWSEVLRCSRLQFSYS
jgi:hypothetical protein